MLLACRLDRSVRFVSGIGEQFVQNGYAASIAPQRNLVAPMSYYPQRGRFGLGNLKLRSPMWLAGLAAIRPSANIASIIPVGLMEGGAVLRRLLDMAPEIVIPVD